jgi:hypothetical protein
MSRSIWQNGRASKACGSTMSFHPTQMVGRAPKRTATPRAGSEQQRPGVQICLIKWSILPSRRANLLADGPEPPHMETCAISIRLSLRQVRHGYALERQLYPPRGLQSSHILLQHQADRLTTGCERNGVGAGVAERRTPSATAPPRMSRRRVHSGEHLRWGLHFYQVILAHSTHQGACMAVTSYDQNLRPSYSTRRSIWSNTL